MDVVVMVLDSTQFLLPDGSWGKSVIIFGVNNSFSVNVYNKKKNILKVLKKKWMILQVRRNKK